MSNHIRISILAVIVLFLSNSVWAQAGKTEELNLGEYYALLTPQLLPILDKYKNRDSLAKETDYANGYLFLAHEEWKGWGEMALFRKASGGFVAAVTQYDCQKLDLTDLASRSRNCRGNINLVMLVGKKLVSANHLLPKEKSLMLYRAYEKKTGRLANSEDKLVYELPRERKDIRILLAGEVVYSMKWNGRVFEGSYVE